MTTRPTRGSGGHGRRVSLALVLVVGLFALVVALPAGADQKGEPRGPDAPPTDEARGLVYKGLEPKDRGPCKDGFRVRVGDGSVVCTHGPDPAPEGADVTEPVPVADLTSGTTGEATAADAVPCIGDGVSGQRVQAIYAVASDKPDRYSSIAPLIAGWAAQMDSAVNQSAAETGGERHIRFVTNPDCTLNVAHVVLSPTGDDTFANTINELKALGYSRTDDQASTYPDGVFIGPKIALLNENSASDGDIFPAMFREAGLGPLVGRRSWGGVVGISGRGPLMDGGTIFVPEFGFASAKGEWTIEGYGVAPDIEVENDPRALIEGHDPQLERAVAELIKKLQMPPATLPPKPAGPIKTERKQQ